MVKSAPLRHPELVIPVGAAMTRFLRWDRPALYVLALLFSVTAPTGFAQAAPTVRIHYHRDVSDYTGWQLYTWYGALNPSPQWNPAQPPTAPDGFGVYYDVAVNTADTGLNFILHDASGNNKNCPNDMFFPFPPGIKNGTQNLAEIWQLQDDCTIYTSVPAFKVGDVNKAKAHWLLPDTIAWPGADSANTYRLYYAADGGITSDASGVSGGASIRLSVVPLGLSADLREKYPFIATATALSLRPKDLPAVPGILKGQVVVARFDRSGKLVDATGLQIPGVLDSLCTYSGKLGAVVGHGSASDPGDPAGGIQFRLWAPTAKSVKLYVYDSPTLPASKIVPMSWNSETCVWTADGDSSWANRKYYKYEVQVFVRLTGNVETSLVTDPYSLGLSVDSQRSLVIDLRSPETMPLGWEEGRVATGGSGPLSAYELHIRDFSISDTSVPQPDRGKFMAFTDSRSRGMTHLRELAGAGLIYVHLLPSFHIATVPEDPSHQLTPVIPNAA
ncbi:MAG: hypothetical protein E6J64_22750, partial [Deltaproteobacteria bacterium]